MSVKLYYGDLCDEDKVAPVDSYLMRNISCRNCRRQYSAIISCGEWAQDALSGIECSHCGAKPTNEYPCVFFV